MKLYTILQHILFSNWLYGLSVVFLCIEANLQQGLPLNSLFFYALMACTTVAFYTKAYLAEKAVNLTNKRSAWYIQHKRNVKAHQFTLLIIISILSIFVCRNVLKQNLRQVLPTIWLPLMVALPALAYYGFTNRKGAHFNIRKYGWVKPFIIGFVWAGAVNIIPIWFLQVSGNQLIAITVFTKYLFVKNWLFISVLCIMFDIKDYASDYNQQLKTFVVRTGLRFTLFAIIIPLSLLGFGLFIVYGIMHHFSYIRLGLNAIPFILLLIVAYSLHRRKGILYYLAIIDGLMLVKAFCGILAVIITK